MVLEFCNIPEVYAVPVIALLNGECLGSSTCGLAFWPKFSEPIHYSCGFCTNGKIQSCTAHAGILSLLFSHDCVKEKISGVVGSGGCWGRVVSLNYVPATWLPITEKDVVELQSLFSVAAIC